QNNFSVDANTFRGHHELKFGFGWRKATVDSSDTYSANRVISIHNRYPEMIAKITRPGHFLTDAVYTSAYGGDTWTMDRMTLNLRARRDHSPGARGATARVAGCARQRRGGREGARPAGCCQPCCRRDPQRGLTTPSSGTRSAPA